MFGRDEKVSQLRLTAVQYILLGIFLVLAFGLWRLQVARTTIEDEKQRQIDASRADMENSIRGIQNTIKLMAVVLPPIPAVLLFLLVSVRRLARERIGVPVDRLIEEHKA